MLLSGKGKHRRASKAARIVTLAGVTGVAVAAPLMAAGSASAATASEWDRVAQCESGGNWSINTGNGYYGGLQFSSSTWAAYGGKAYAAQANQASKSQQIAIAEKVLKGQGKGAWPSCGVGLSNSSYTGGGTTDTPKKTEQKTETKKTQPKKTEPKKETKRSEAPTTRSERSEAPAPKTGNGSYEVKPGDTLGTIAETNGVKGGWEKLFELNKDIVSDADLIFPGQKLKLS
ncbi:MULTISPECIES: transglycosylase family protein [unclassified Streptomyces]|uniref:LysM peptidoglycan-binding domain-containing protein n=1 Tax=unclassified Streptomyces TaxID=2593676 RepID=UPI0006B15609|nr:MULTISPECIES: transglycosylase family protein [unclassified Streptomyces]KOY50266.1 transglycosylase [Streptomyces sp. XY332]TDU77827.1 LysM domain-containing protein [Streptomyces sp. KS 21]THA34175.1 LysM peptidoglycan-binding domain-containing protein [Streptomyces sp. A1547]